MARSGFVIGQIRLENNVMLTVRVDREFDLILLLQKALYHARIFTHPDMIAAELTRMFQVVGIGKIGKQREIFVDIDAMDEVLTISVPVDEEEMVVYAATFKAFLRDRPDQVKHQWNKVLSTARKERAFVNESGQAQKDENND